VKESVGVRRPVAVEEFVVESRAPDNFVVMHLVEGHRYHFHVTPASDGRRVLGPATRVRQDGRAKHSADLFEASARRFAIREALAVGLIAAADS
jgi:hypothetical protein